MKISYNQLKTLIKIDQSPEELGKILTSTGLEVEGIEKIEQVEGGLEGVVIGEVKTCEKHPDADKLNLTTVDAGQGELLNIVCGAPNVAAGQKVIVALIGAKLYPTEGEPFVIKKSKIRGAASEGMLCAEDEIGLGHSHAGIMVLDTDLPNGTPAIKYLELEPDYMIEIGLTPNRADAASHFGVARDIKAVSGETIVLPDTSSFVAGETKGSIEVSVENNTDCPRFCGLEIRGVEVKESPEWLKAFLRTIGVNSINNIVDITNYICHYLGQPMHIFDADQIDGKQLIVKTPEKDTLVTTLDGTERKLSGYDLAICNASGPMAIAGVFGGINSGVKAETKNIFLEVAYFNPSAVRKTASFHGLKTDASFRYERGTDPNMPPFAIKVAALLVKELAGGQIADIIDVYPDPVQDFEITLKYKNINRLIGKTLDAGLIRKILESLDIKVVSEDAETLKVNVPPYRVDVQREADVIEEILRIYGFENVEESAYLQSDFISNFPVNDPDDLKIRLSELLSSRSFHEIQTLSIVKPSENQALKESVKGGEVKLLNPLSEELSVMRQGLLFSGLNALAYNINRRSRDLKFFEFGRSYHRQVTDQGSKIKESKVLGVWLTGNKNAETWKSKSESVSFYDLSELVKVILESMKISGFKTSETQSSLFEYGVSYLYKNKEIVSFGSVHPSNLKFADVKQQVFYAEFDWDLLTKSYTPEVKFTEIPKYPEVRRDLSLVVDKAVKFSQIEALASSAERKLLKSVNLFDIYEGDKLEAGKKAYAVSFTLLDEEKTLNDTLIDKTMQRLMGAFEKELGAIIRK